MNSIREFKKEYRFLSNFWPCIIIVNDIKFPSVEHAYQAGKTNNIDIKMIMSKIKRPGDVKIYGKELVMIDDFDENRVKFMTDLVRQKFTDPDLRRKLLTTRGKILIEGNTWHDNFWGSCYCSKCGDNGLNMLGKILMNVREEIEIYI